MSAERPPGGPEAAGTPRRQGFAVLFTGLSGAGKSTLAAACAAMLRERTGRPVTLLDGDAVRRTLSDGLGFSRSDRETHLRRVGFVAAEVARHGGIALCALIAPHAAGRRALREAVEAQGRFVEVHVSTPLAACEARDPRGLYALARAGRIRGFTGIDDPYEAPGRPDAAVDTDGVTPAAAARRVLAALERLGLVPPPGGTDGACVPAGRGRRRPPVTEPDPSAGPAYDYVLAVGPGRSGTTFLYRALNAHPGFRAPEIKEAHYYRSARRLERALAGLRGSGAMLLDVADTAWSDPRLDRVSALTEGGMCILLVVLLRRHRDWARSMLAYRRSRVLPALPAILAGPGGLERAVVRDALTAEALERMFALGADVLTIEFETLTGEPGPVLDALARLCRTGPFGPIDTAPVNPAERARFAPLAAATKLAAWALRAAGARRTLQALKDDPRLVRLVFRPACADELPALSEAASARLDRREAECRAAVAAAGEPLGDGLWLARAAPRPPARRSSPRLPE